MKKNFFKIKEFSWFNQKIAFLDCQDESVVLKLFSNKGISIHGKTKVMRTDDTMFKNLQLIITYVRKRDIEKVADIMSNELPRNMILVKGIHNYQDICDKFFGNANE